MAQTTSPLNWQTPIVNPDGTMTEPFRRLLQALTGNGQASGDVVQQLVDAELQQGSGISILPDGHLLSNPTIAAEVQPILDQISNVRGSVLYRGAGQWDALAPGTSGNFLKTNGAGADPAWAAAGGGGSAWHLVDQSGAPITSGATWTWSTNVTQVDVTGLGLYTDFLVVCRLVSTSVSGNRAIQVSTDNGVSFYSSTGDYQLVSTTGTETAATSIALQATASTAARTFGAPMLGFGATGGPKYCAASSGESRLFTASPNPVNALRLLNTAGGNLTAGSLFVFAR